MAIPQAFIDELLSRVDLVEVIGRYVPLKRTGANFQGLCPFHSEKSPSFTVSPSKQFFHCFGCGKSGNAIGFLMEHAGSGFVDAVRELAQQVGMTVPQEQLSAQELARQQAQRAQRKTLTDVLEQAAHAYAERLRTTPLAQQYLRQRGLSHTVIERFGLGYAPDTWHGLASVFAAYDDPLLEQAGLVIHNAQEDRRYDRFRARVMFPIRNERGECIGFGGRVLGDEKPKYLNSPETPVFNKGHELYGLYEARQAIRNAGYVLVTEGYMDVVALAQLGLPHGVATLGTACTPEHLKKLFRVTDQIVFSFDGDAAGRRAAAKALQVALPMATDVRTVKFLFLPPEHDPDSFVRQHGRAAFEEAVRQAMPLSRFLLEIARDGLDLDTAEGRAQAAVRAGTLWQQLPAGALAQQVLGDVAHLVQFTPEQLHALWQRTDRAGRSTPAPANSSSTHTNASSHQRKLTHTPSPSEPPPFSSWDTPPSVGSGHGHRSVRVSNTRGWPARGSGMVPAARGEHAARLLLAQMALWETLSEHEHDLLCHQPEPVGPLIRWLDAQYQDHGPLAWGMLSERLQSQPFAAFAQGLMRLHKDLCGLQSAAEMEEEMRSIMFGIRREACAAEATRAAEANDLEGLRRAKRTRAELDEEMAAWAAQRAARAR